tara:strand:- start:4453 stop:6369 length:1917 start_codon:yes stop_codon:yes gene_type:complete
MKVAYSHLVKYIDENPSIENISEKLFQLGHENEFKDRILDIEITPNRGDCLSIRGILRDLSAFYTINFDEGIYNEPIKDLSIDFENLAYNACPKISFLKLEIDHAPLSYNGVLADYFKDLHINNVNFFTDVSNYISYETGQPTHCYDTKKINGKIVFNEIKENYEFAALTEKNYSLTKKNAVFLMNDEVINLAGIMGGRSTSCSKETRSVLVECAYFNPDMIIGKALKYDIQSDAAHKFERGVDFNSHEKTLRRFIKIISDHVKINNLSFITHTYNEKKITSIPIDIKKINQIIGVNITEDQYLNHLNKLGFEKKEGSIRVPSYRNDVRTQNDLAEEIARIIGYDNITISRLELPFRNIEIDDGIENEIKSILISNGFYEVINQPFVNVSSKNSIKVDNPLDSNREHLRTSLMPSLIENLLFNERRQHDSIKFFEISDVYYLNNGIEKKKRLALIASGRVGLNYRDFSKKIDKEYLSKIFKVIFPSETFNFKNISRENLDSKIKSEIISLEIDIDNLPKQISECKEKFHANKVFNRYQSISDLPLSYKDISYSIKDFTKTNDLIKLIDNFNHKILKDSFIFDYFYNKKNNEIKIGFRFIFQSKDSTLTSEEIEGVINRVIKKSIKIQGISIPGHDLMQ